MNPLEEFYKLGQSQAVEDFMTSLASEDDNPTSAPPKEAAKIAVDKFLDKYSKERTTRAPLGKHSPFKALVKKKKSAKSLAAAVGKGVRKRK